MRPIEALLLLANSLTFLALAVPRPRTGARASWLPLFVVLMGLAQVLLEGARWQMIPAYLLGGLLLLTWWLRRNAARGKKSAASTQTRRLLFSLLVVLGVLGLAASSAPPVLVPVFHFPRPTGSYAIGTMTYDWTDMERPEIFTTAPRDNRELMVQVWYPAKPAPSAPRAPYVENADRLASALGRLLFHVPPVTLSYLKYVTSNAVESAPIADGSRGYPVLIFLHGVPGFRQMNTLEVQELVSHGYVIVAIDQSYAAAAVVFHDGHEAVGLPLEKMLPLIGASVMPSEGPASVNGQVLEAGIIPYLAEDVTFVLDQLAAINESDPNDILTGRLDLQRAGVFGISLGGIEAGEACRLDARLRACLVMDAPLPADVVQAGLQQPTMWISRDVKTMELEGWSHRGARGIDALQASMSRVFETLPGDGYVVLVPGMFHLNLTDLPYYSPLTSWAGMTGPIDAARAHDIINAYSLAFFDEYLKGQRAALLDGPTEQYPDVFFRRHRP